MRRYWLRPAQPTTETLRSAAWDHVLLRLGADAAAMRTRLADQVVADEAARRRVAHARHTTVLASVAHTAQLGATVDRLDPPPDPPTAPIPGLPQQPPPPPETARDRRRRLRRRAGELGITQHGKTDRQLEDEIAALAGES